MDKKTEAILALVLNIFTIPGIGSLVAGQKKEGIWQLVLAVVSIPLMLILIGGLTYLAAWIWGIVTGVRLLKEAN